MLPIVDPHVRLRSAGAFVRPTDPDAPTERDYLLDDLFAETGDTHVLRAVHVQDDLSARDALAETAWVQRVARTPGSGGLPNGIVACCDLAHPDAAAHLDALAAHANVRGVRQRSNTLDDLEALVADDRGGGFLDEPLWLERFAALEGIGLSFDLRAGPRDLERTARLAARFPATAIVLDLAGPPREASPAALSRWRDGLARVGARDNVCVKISDAARPDVRGGIERGRRLVGDVVDRFGFERVMFASRFPPARREHSYEELWRTFSKAAAGVPARQRDALFRGNAVRVYRL